MLAANRRAMVESSGDDSSSLFDRELPQYRGPTEGARNEYLFTVLGNRFSDNRRHPCCR